MVLKVRWNRASLPLVSLLSPSHSANGKSHPSSDPSSVDSPDSLGFSASLAVARSHPARPPAEANNSFAPLGPDLDSVAVCLLNIAAWQHPISRLCAWCWPRQAPHVTSLGKYDELASLSGCFCSLT